jgi:hypothetical protein
LSIPTTISWFNAPPTMAASAPVPEAPVPAAAAEESGSARDWDADDEEDGQHRR